MQRLCQTNGVKKEVVIYIIGWTMCNRHFCTGNLDKFQSERHKSMAASVIKNPFKMAEGLRDITSSIYLHNTDNAPFHQDSEADKIAT